MEKKEIIDGLKDLIKDRESFITEGAPKSWKTDTDRIFEHDKQVLEEAINTIQAQQQEIDKLQQWVNDLQAGMYVNCVYCGHRYGMEKDTPVSMADVLKEHIEHCHKHPMSAFKQQIKALTADKEEQAGRIMQMEDGLEKAKQMFKNIEIITSCPETGNERNAMQMAIDGHRLMVALLGGKEDEN